MFQFQFGSVKRIVLRSDETTPAGFNSNSVRLKEGIPAKKPFLGSSFNSNSVRLKVVSNKLSDWSIVKFQFQFGSVKSYEGDPLNGSHYHVSIPIRFG